MAETGADFAYGDALHVLWGDDHERVLPIVIEKGTVVVTLHAPEGKGDGEPEGWLIAWPGMDQGIVAMIRAGRDGASNEFLAGWPISSGGVLHELLITDVLMDEDCSLLRLYECSVRGVSMDLFDSLCAGSQRGLASGDRIMGRVHGWATMLERAPGEPIVIAPEDASPDMRQAFSKDFERDGKLVIHTEELACLLPTSWAGSCPLHEVQGIVRAVRTGPPILGRSVFVLTTTVVRPDNGDIDIDISVTSEIWRGDDPHVGDVVRGIVWLQIMFEK